MNSFEYSVIIRTIGKAGEKYQKLLNSIKSLSPAPKEVIVVLPNGYDKPKEQLGWETFYYSEKGMVHQRTYGFSVCKTKYALVCDDDVSFEGDFVSKVSKPVVEGHASISAGPLYSFLPKKGLQTLVCCLISSAYPTVFNRKNYCTFLSNTGYSYNRHLKLDKEYYYSQAVPGTCFFVNVEDVMRVNVAEEVWIDSHGYSAMEDGALIYKAYLMGMNICVVPSAYYVHNDAKTSTKNNSKAFLYSMGFNRVVFWHRYIFTKKKNIFSKGFSIISFRYHSFCCKLLQRVNHSKEDYLTMKSGYKDGYAYLKSSEYLSLPKIGD